MGTWTTQQRIAAISANLHLVAANPARIDARARVAKALHDLLELAPDFIPYAVRDVEGDEIDKLMDGCQSYYNQ